MTRRPSRRLLDLAGRLDRPGYPPWVKALDWVAGRLAERRL